jgi:hypothetical protein
MINIKRFWFCVVLVGLCSVCSASTVPYKDNSEPKYEALTPIVKRISITDGTVKIGYDANAFSPLGKDSFDIKPVAYTETKADRVADRFGKLIKTIVKWVMLYGLTIMVILIVVTILGGLSVSIVYLQHMYMEHKKGE